MNPSDDLTNTNASQTSGNTPSPTGSDPIAKSQVSGKGTIRWKRASDEESSRGEDSPSAAKSVKASVSEKDEKEEKELDDIQSEIESLLQELDSLDGKLGSNEEMSPSQKAALSSIEDRKAQEVKIEEDVPKEDPEEVKKMIESLKQEIFTEAGGQSEKADKGESISGDVPRAQKGEIPSRGEAKKGVEHTYYDDLSKVMSAHDPKTMSELIQKSRFERKVQEILSFKSRKNILYLVGSIVLIAAAVFLFSFVLPKKEKVEYVKEAKVPSLVQAEKSTGIKINTIDAERLKKAIKTLIEEKIPEKTIHHIYYAYVDNFGGIKKAGFHEVLQKLNVTLPEKIDKEIQEEFMHGVYRNGKNYPFLLLRVNSYDKAFEGMQEWEPDMIDDIGVFLDLPEEAYDRSLLEPGYSDDLIRNKNVRVARFLPRSVDREGSIEDIYPEEKTGGDSEVAGTDASTEGGEGETSQPERDLQALLPQFVKMLGKKVHSLVNIETVFAQAIEAPQGLDEIIVQRRAFGGVGATSNYIQDLKIKRGGSNGIISGTLLGKKLRRDLRNDNAVAFLAFGDPHDRENYIREFYLKDGKRRDRFEIDGSRIFDSDGNMIRTELVIGYQLSANNPERYLQAISLRPAIQSAIREGIILDPKGPANNSQITESSGYERTEKGNIRLKNNTVACRAFEWECYDDSGNPVPYNPGDSSQFCIKKVKTDRLYGAEVLDENGNPKGNYVCTKTLGNDVILDDNIKSETYLCYPAKWECRDPQGILIPHPSREDIDNRANICIKYADRSHKPIYDNTGALVGDIRYHCTPYSGGGVMRESHYKDTVGSGAPDIVIEQNVWDELLGMLESDSFIGLKCNLVGTNCRYEDPASIRATQKFLKLAGLMDPSSPTGQLDVLTQDILSDFQAINGLNPTGVIDADTASLITSITQALAGGESLSGEQYGVAGNISLYGGSGIAAINDYISPEQVGLGAYNEQVQALQVFLYAEGYPVSQLNGFLDGDLYEVIQQYEKDHGLPVSQGGKVNSETIDFINSEIEKKGYIGSGFKLDGDNLLGFGILEGRYGPGSASADLMYEDEFEKGDIVLIYTFLDEHTILITTHETVIDEIVKRRALSDLFEKTK